jgi:hypothetical protein
MKFLTVIFVMVMLDTGESVHYTTLQKSFDDVEVCRAESSQVIDAVNSNEIATADVQLLCEPVEQPAEPI